jgi:hypothetical protein
MGCSCSKLNRLYRVPLKDLFSKDLTQRAQLAMGSEMPEALGLVEVALSLCWVPVEDFLLT